MKRIPLVPVPLEKALQISKKFRWISQPLARIFPGLKRDLYQSEIDIKPIDYVGIAVFSSLFYSILIGGLVTLIGLIVRNAFDPLGIFIGMIFLFISFYFIILYPKVIVRRRTKQLEKNLLFALRHMLIEIKSGIPLFDSLVGVSTGYGELSKEFMKIVKEINAGKSQIEALNMASERNPSLYFRRALWQIVNAIKAGSDIADTLEVITDNLAEEQLNQIKSYGQELNPWTMLYMIIGVIAPSLGVTFLIILSSFSGIVVPKAIFPAILIGLVMFQIFFIGFIKSKRPSIAV
ncbi:MAG TPA: hypothetical protein ENF95_01860 [Candidatus Aenigmarchaeota archaeon]|nr:hypothetical protein [Candidatus Aenigmarchaeota archaeon]